LEIALRTRSERILQDARSVAIGLLVRFIGRNDLESQYEAACWVDGLTEGTMNEFCQLLEDAGKVTSPFALELVRAWNKAHLPPPVPRVQLSALLRQSLHSLTHFTDQFQRFLIQILTRCLLCQGNPVPLAVMIVGSAEADDVSWQPFRPLVDYCQVLVYFDRYTMPERIQRVARLARWDRGPWAWLQSHLATVALPRPFFNAQLLVLAQQVLQLEKVLPQGTLDVSNVIRKVLGVALLVCFKWILQRFTILLLMTHSFITDLSQGT
jgi:hypothetical protein